MGIAAFTSTKMHWLPESRIVFFCVLTEVEAIDSFKSDAM